MPNILIGTISAAGPNSVDVDTASKTIVTGSTLGTSRVGLIITNLSDGTIYLAFGGYTAVLNTGVPILGSGGNWSMDEYSYTKDAVQAISHSDNSLVAYQEFYN